MNILCISGKRGSGKSMLAEFLSCYGFRRMSLADDLKNKCMADFGLTDEQVRGAFKESPTQYKRTDGHYLTPRDIMIRCGIYYRSIDPLFWCKQLDRNIDVDDHKIVIDDIRFLNEIAYFKNLGAKFIRLERKQELNVYKAALDDLSETELDTYDKWDYKLLEEFNQTPQDLEKFAEFVLEGEHALY